MLFFSIKNIEAEAGIYRKVIKSIIKLNDYFQTVDKIASKTTEEIFYFNNGYSFFNRSKTPRTKN